MEQNQLFQWKCKTCGKEIISLYKSQFEQNVQAHELTHKNEVVQNGKQCNREFDNSEQVD